MVKSNMVCLEISNISKELFEYILVDITTMVANIHFSKDFSTANLYNCIASKDNYTLIMMLRTWC